MRSTHGLIVISSCLLLSWAMSDPAEFAGDIISESGVQGGLVVHLGCGNGELTRELHLNERYLVHALDSDIQNVRKSRQTIKSAGLSGAVSCEHWAEDYLPYADNLVNLVVVSGGGFQIPGEEFKRVLAPDGVLVANQEPGISNLELVEGGPWLVYRKPVPDSIDSWTHYLHGPDNNAVARDTEVGPPKHVQWRDGPLWCRSHEMRGSFGSLVSDGKRIFFANDDGWIGQRSGVAPNWTVTARDAFNGVFQWKRAIEKPSGIKRRMVAVGNRVYLPIDKGGISILDAATGRVVGNLEGTEQSTEHIVSSGLVVAHVSGKKGASSRLMAFDAGSGVKKWESSVSGYSSESLAATDTHVFHNNGKRTVAQDLRTGKELWQAPCGKGGNLLVYKGKLFTTAGKGVQAFSISDGKLLWRGPRSGSDFFGAGGLVWINQTDNPGRHVAWTPIPYVTVGLDPETGLERKRLTLEKLVTPGHHLRCYRAKATERYILQRKRGTEFIDLAGDSHMRCDWLRGACHYGVMPANGLLYAPPHPCLCYRGASMNGFNATASRLARKPVKIPDGERLLRGRIHDIPLPASDHVKSDWPMYRHDALRSGASETKVPDQIEKRWEYSACTVLTPPIVIGKRLFTAKKDSGVVCCLDATTGRPIWEYIVDARVDSSPTYYKGRLFFGSADGRVHCVRATDGEMIWRFQAAPFERRVVAFNRLESAWPAHGSVIILNGLLYCTAGRSSFLDGGIRVYALDPITAEVVHRTTIRSTEPDVENEIGKPFEMDGVRTDLLTSDGEDLYLLQEQLGPDLETRTRPKLVRMGNRRAGMHLITTSGFLDDSWFNRNFWTYSREWPGFYLGHRASKTGQLVVFDKERAYSVKVFDKRAGHSAEHALNGGYGLVADHVSADPVLLPSAIGRDKSEGFARSTPAVWNVTVPLRPKAMVLAGDKLCIAGFPDAFLANHSPSELGKCRESELWIMSAATGEKISSHPLTQPPMFDGLIAAQGSLFVTSWDGRITCFGRAN